jgi:hypothetical protein
LEKSVSKGDKMIAHTLDEIKPGMHLAEPVYDFHEVLLLKAGTKLTSQSIRLLRSWGISKVWISGKAIPPPAKRDAQREKRIHELVAKYLQAKFDGVLDDPVMVTIMEAASALITERYLKRAQENETD